MATRKPPLLLYAGAIVLVLGLLLSIVVVPVKSDASSPAGDFNGDGASDGEYSVTVQYIDKNGNLLHVMPYELIADGGGEEVDHISIYASWSVSGENVDWSTLTVTVNVKVREQLQDGSYATYFSATGQSTGEKTGGKFFYVYEEDLSEIADGHTHTLNVWVEFTATVYDTLGHLVSDKDTIASEGFSVSIVSGGTLAIDGTVTFDESMNVVSFSALDVGDSPITNPATAMMLVGGAILVAYVCSGRRVL